MNPSVQGATALDFWESAFQNKKDLAVIDHNYFANKGRVTQREFATLLGDVKGLEVLDIGCGSGELSVFLANKGAKVTSSDFSANALRNTGELAKHNKVQDRIELVQTDALELPKLDKRYDLLVGRFVLHHIEPFDQFTEVLHEMIADRGGRGVFMENNSNNPFLMVARKYLAGRMGIPKYGDDDEYPLEQREVEMLHKKFDNVYQHFPELIFFRKLNTYIFRHKKMFSPFMSVNSFLDDTVYNIIPPMRKLSYLQLVEMVKKPKK